MTIAYCLPELLRAGGIERIITTKANYLAEHGYEVHIITTDQGDVPPVYPLDERVQLHDLGLFYHKDNDLGRYKRMLAQIEKRKRHARALEQVLRQIGAEVTISTFFHEASILPTLKDGSRKVLELHSSKFRRIAMYPPEAKLMRLYGRLMTYLDERIVRKYDRFVVLTEEDKGYWGDIKGIRQIPNACPLPIATAEELPAEREKTLLAVGRYVYGKNFERLIQLWPELKRQHPEWKLEIFGDGFLRPMYNELIEKLGIGDSVVLHRTTSDLRPHYLRSSLFVMLSEWEGLPMAMLEAEASGLPIVSYACPTGPRDIIGQGEQGILIPQGDEAELTRVLSRLMGDEATRQRMERAALSDAQRFTLERVIQSWTQLFAELKH